MSPIEISLLIGFLGFIMAGVVNVAIVARWFGKIDTSLNQNTDIINRLDRLVTSLYERSESDRNRITKLETAQEMQHRQHSSNGGGSYKVETPRFGREA